MDEPIDFTEWWESQPSPSKIVDVAIAGDGPDTNAGAGAGAPGTAGAEDEAYLGANMPSMFLSMARVAELRRMYERQSGVRYSHVISCRFDDFVLSLPPLPTLLPDQLYFSRPYFGQGMFDSDGEPFVEEGGVLPQMPIDKRRTDLLVVGPPSLHDAIMGGLSEHLNATYHAAGTMRPESLIEHHGDALGLRRNLTYTGEIQVALVREPTGRSGHCIDTLLERRVCYEDPRWRARTRRHLAGST